MKYALYILNITLLLPLIVYYSTNELSVRDAYAMICLQIVLVGIAMLLIIRKMSK